MGEGSVESVEVVVVNLEACVVAGCMANIVSGGGLCCCGCCCCCLVVIHVPGEYFSRFGLLLSLQEQERVVGNVVDVKCNVYVVCF